MFILSRIAGYGRSGHTPQDRGKDAGRAHCYGGAPVAPAVNRPGATGGRRGFLIAHPVAWQWVMARSGPSAPAGIILLGFPARIGDYLPGGEFSVGGVTDRALGRSACGRGPDQDDG